jgi:hypothetical protein
MRPTKSDAPPGANGTIIRMGCLDTLGEDQRRTTIPRRSKDLIMNPP